MSDVKRYYVYGDHLFAGDPPLSASSKVECAIVVLASDYDAEVARLTAELAQGKVDVSMECENADRAYLKAIAYMAERDALRAALERLVKASRDYWDDRTIGAEFLHELRRAERSAGAAKGEKPR